jgi:hypothetical protein
VSEDERAERIVDELLVNPRGAVRCGDLRHQRETSRWRRLPAASVPPYETRVYR